MALFRFYYFCLVVILAISYSSTAKTTVKVTTKGTAKPGTIKTTTKAKTTVKVTPKSTAKPGTTKPTTKGIFVEKTSNDNFMVSCGNAFVSYCGLRNSQTQNQEKYRYTIPADKQSCRCYDYFGVTCRAYCTPREIQGFEIVSKNFKGESTVSCPGNKQVLGCNAVPSNTGYEAWPHFYPTSDGKQCNCYNYFGVSCVATCASDLKGYEVVKTSGKGNFKATCPPGKFVRGCGIKPNTSGQELWRTVTVDDETSCSCYDFFGASCYAVCTQ